MENTIPITPITAQPITPAPKKDGKWLLWGLIGFTLILLITAIILFFQLRKPAVTPAPKPKASPQTVPVQQQQPEGVCSLSFTVTASPSPVPSASPGVSPSPSPVASASPGASPSPSPVASASPNLSSCFDTCDNDSQCMSGLRCMTVSSQKRCTNPTCTEDTDCTCGSSPVPSASPQVAASVQPSASPQLIAAGPAPSALPKAGTNAPLVLGVSAGILMMLLGLLF